MLGRAQERWLSGAFSQSGARWNLIAQQVWVMPLQGREPEGGLHGPYEDKWDGFPDSRRRLIQGLAATPLAATALPALATLIIC